MDSDAHLGPDVSRVSKGNPPSLFFSIFFFSSKKKQKRKTGLRTHIPLTGMITMKNENSLSGRVQLSAHLARHNFAFDLSLFFLFGA